MSNMYHYFLNEKYQKLHFQTMDLPEHNYSSSYTVAHSPQLANGVCIKSTIN